MASRLFKARLRASLALACCACIAGCSALGGHRPVQALQADRLQAGKAMQAVTIGKSSKADVQAALGRPIAIPFDSGWEVWVYRWGDSPGRTWEATELVVLFAPSGLVQKVRVRPGEVRPQ